MLLLHIKREAACSTLLILLPAFCPQARAGLSFIQVVQAQTSHGNDGVFGKTWVELQGHKMRLVSGYAGKLLRDGRAEEPSRMIQILDLDAKTRFILCPEKKMYARAPLGNLDYDSRMTQDLRRGRPIHHVKLLSAKLSKQGHTRKLLDTICEHYRLKARFSLQSAGLQHLEGYLYQDVWVAPLTGPLSRTVLDLIAFENAYRAATGGSLSPLDYERYQLREAAAYLQVPQENLQPIVEQLRDRFRGLPSYPVASSVSWWLLKTEKKTDKIQVPLAGKTGSPRNPVFALKQAMRQAQGPPFRPPQFPPYAKSGLGVGATAEHPTAVPRLKVIDWHSSERRINRMYSRTRNQFAGNFPLGPLAPRIVKLNGPRGHQEPSIYPNFHTRMEEILRLLVQTDRKQQGSRLSEQSRGGKAPFYEIYAELHGLEAASEIPETDFFLPEDFSETSLENALRVK